MKHGLPHLVPTIFSFSLLFFSLQLSQAQTSHPAKDTRFKTAEVLRELQPQASTARSKSQRTLDVNSNFRKIAALQVRDGYVAIDAVSKLENGQELLNQLQKLGLQNGSVYGRKVSGFFPIENIDQLENVGQLNRVMPAYTPVRKSGVVVSQGKAASKAQVAEKEYRVTGAGSKIGILSDTYGSSAAGVASGDLPANAEILSDYKDGPDEGRAIAEIVHDLAPGAKIAFHSGFPGQAAFANGILSLAEAGCNIILDDIMYPDEPMFQDGIIAQAVNKVVKNNVAYFSAAGNQGRQSYQAAFKNSGKLIIINGDYYGVAHDFGGGDITQTFHIPANGTLQLPFQWDDAFYSVSGGAGARTDLDVLFFYQGQLLTSLSSMYGNEGDDPFEYIAMGVEEADDIEIMITKYSGPDPKIMKWVNYGNSYPLEHLTNSSTLYGHANAEGAIAVGASAWFNTPAFNKNIKIPVINYFSSMGGTPVVINPDGKRAATAIKIRQKPTLVGPDGGNTTFFGDDIPQDADNMPNFFGTSAATPHVAAIAALMQEFSQTSLSPASIEDFLKKAAIDMDDPGTAGFDTGYDALTGWGFVQADKALELVAQANCTASGTLAREQFNSDNLGGKPLVSTLTSFEANNKGNYFTARLFGYICPPKSGNYTFWISGDDATRLILSTDATPEKSQLIAYSTSPTNFRDYKKYPTQKSVPVYLQAGRRYYIEAQHVELWAGDHVTVAWQLPDGNFEGPIAGAHLSPYVPAETPKEATVAIAPVYSRIANKEVPEITSIPANNIVISPNPFSGKTALSFLAAEEGSLAVEIISPQGTLVKTLYKGTTAAGAAYNYTFDGDKFASGVYICRLTLNGQVTYKRMVLIK